MNISRKNLLEKVGSMRQVASVRRSVLDDGKGRGMRIIDVDNGSGLRFTVYPDRGMDIGEASFKGVPLVWLTPGGFGCAESYEVEDFNWLRSWGGGLLTTCGLLNVGGPCEAGEKHGLHGRISHLKGSDVNTGSSWDENGNFVLEVSGKVMHSKVFGEKLELTRRISTSLGDNRVIIEDQVENTGFAPSPFMMLYHMNFSWPLVDENTRLIADEHPVVPKDEVSVAGLDDWSRCCAPVPGFAEQLYYHDLPADNEGMAKMTLVNPDLKLAMSVEYSKETLPFLVQWKQMGQGEYVLGLEPGNCVPENQLNNRAKNLLKMLAPGEKVRHKVVLSFESLN